MVLLLLAWTKTFQFSSDTYSFLFFITYFPEICCVLAVGAVSFRFGLSYGLTWISLLLLIGHPEECVLPDSSTSGIETISQDDHDRDDLSVKGSALRPFNSTLGFHQSFHSGLDISPPKGLSSALIFGRLASSLALLTPYVDSSTSAILKRPWSCHWEE